MAVVYVVSCITCVSSRRCLASGLRAVLACLCMSILVMSLDEPNTLSGLLAIAVVYEFCFETGCLSA